MSKNVIITWVVAIVIILILALGWWYFTKTNSTVITTNKQEITSANGEVAGNRSEKSITSFNFLGLNLEGNQTIDDNNHGVTLVVPHGADLLSLTPIISVSDGSTISPDSGAVQNFTNPVAYTVTPEGGFTAKQRLGGEIN